MITFVEFCFVQFIPHSHTTLSFDLSDRSDWAGSFLVCSWLGVLQGKKHRCCGKRFGDSVAGTFPSKCLIQSLLETMAGFLLTSMGTGSEPMLVLSQESQNSVTELCFWKRYLLMIYTTEVHLILNSSWHLISIPRQNSSLSNYILPIYMISWTFNLILYTSFAVQMLLKSCCVPP